LLIASKATCTQVAQNGQNRSRAFAVFLLVGRCPNPPDGSVAAPSGKAACRRLLGGLRRSKKFIALRYWLRLLP